jgi:hypothetical protein
VFTQVRPAEALFVGPDRADYLNTRSANDDLFLQNGYGIIYKMDLYVHTALRKRNTSHHCNIYSSDKSACTISSHVIASVEGLHLEYRHLSVVSPW